MGMIIRGNKLVVIPKPKATYFYFPEDVGNNLKHKINFIIKYK